MMDALGTYGVNDHRLTNCVRPCRKERLEPLTERILMMRDSLFASKG